MIVVSNDLRNMNWWIVTFAMEQDIKTVMSAQHAVGKAKYPEVRLKITTGRSMTDSSNATPEIQDNILLVMTRETTACITAIRSRQLRCVTNREYVYE